MLVVLLDLNLTHGAPDCFLFGPFVCLYVHGYRSVGLIDCHLGLMQFLTKYLHPFTFTVHQNYVGLDTDKRIVFLSVVLTDANNHNVPQYRSILWRTTVSPSRDE